MIVETYLINIMKRKKKIKVKARIKEILIRRQKVKKVH
jgi:hypothetical protein